MGTYRILLDCHTFDVGPQGTTSFLAGIANNLAACAKRRGIALELHCAAEDKANVDRYLSVPYVYHKISGGFVERNLFWLPRLSFRIKSHYVFSQYVRPAIAKGATVVVIHDLLFIDFPRLFGLFYRLIRTAMFFLSARGTDHVVTVSNYSRGRIARCFGIPSECIVVVPNGLAPLGAIRAPTGRPKQIRLLSVSRLEKRKRHEWCIKAVEDLQGKGIDAHLTIVGNGSDSYASLVRAEAQRANDAANTEKITLSTGLSDRARDEIYRRSDILLFPSEAEGFGIPVIEAAALGLPCIVARNTALKELSRYFAGRSFASNSYTEFLQAIIDVTNAFAEVEQEAVALSAVATANFSWDRSSQILVDHVLAGAIRAAEVASAPMPT
jgi:glycosyltransferase involved in cell wall biosynthesis